MKIQDLVLVICKKNNVSKRKALKILSEVNKLERKGLSFKKIELEVLKMIKEF